MITMTDDGILLDDLLVPWTCLREAGMINESILRCYIKKNPKFMEELVWTVYRNHLVQ